jgi:hypothetical protein
MTDIVERLRKWANVVPVPPAAQTMQQAAAEIDGLRKAIRRLVDQDATLSVQGGSVIVTMDATLTDEEREAIEDAAGICEEHAEEYDGTTSSLIADILRNLLARLA